MTRPKTVIVSPTHWHVPLYADRIAARCEVVGVSDPDTAGATPFAELWDAPLHSDWRQLLCEHQDAELAYVFAAHDTMREVCLALIELQIPFVVEKPAGISLHQLSEIRQAAEAAEVPAAVPLVQRGGPTERWLEQAGTATYESVQFIAGPPTRYLHNGSPWMVDPARAGGGCAVNLAPHFVDLFLRGSHVDTVAVRAAMSSTLHGGSVEDYASLTLTAPNGAIATIEVGYAFPGSPLKRHCAFLRIGPSGAATIWADGSASFTDTSGATRTELIDVDSDPLYAPFVDAVADSLGDGFAGLPSLADLEATMTVIWDAYAYAEQGGANVDTQH
ncbi:Gfo/Idh/MocA family oxidoreductase (plasmid) [Herbiconiux sp. KACC 21604]|uniref:Gfo/Idh/MocA family protein n=1 Tax=unclassified Herbiconiux TaxID=2618217 RepID=UPI0014909439|nr:MULTISPECIES: Gfo/Idh/MocA family oxidoreductase [unclassified Herbiconiux]QJU56331.1 Gfo/Idh/MocA family oxidoreductase [Herbiconiux sp. SALV-R1]WPO88838.1 Gfo/Idh/MocA family oxidoreductase [Herbiconiux sp. KACC 21604]